MFTQVNDVKDLASALVHESSTRFCSWAAGSNMRCPVGSAWCFPHGLAHRLGYRQKWLCRIHDSMVEEVAEAKATAIGVAGLGMLPTELLDRLHTVIEGSDDLGEHEDDSLVQALLDEAMQSEGPVNLMIDPSIADEPEPPPGTAPSYVINPDHLRGHMKSHVPIGSPDCMACNIVREQRSAAVRDWNRG